MYYIIKTRAGRRFFVTPSAIRNAEWIDTGETAPRWIDHDGSNLILCASADDHDLTRYWTDDAGLRVRDESGRVTRIPFTIVYDWSQDGLTEYFVDGDEADLVVAGPWNEFVSAVDILDFLGLPCEAPEIDYNDLAEAYIADHPEYSWWEADERGFANEWHLVAAPAGFDPEGYSYELRPLTAEEAVRDLAIAVMPDAEYRARYGLDHCISAVVED